MSERAFDLQLKHIQQFLDNKTLATVARLSRGCKSAVQVQLDYRREIWVDSFCHDAPVTNSSVSTSATRKCVFGQSPGR